jgi:hypothetical protein
MTDKGKDLLVSKEMSQESRLELREKGVVLTKRIIKFAWWGQSSPITEEEV